MERCRRLGNLERGEVHLWVRFFPDPPGPQELQKASECLDQGEKERLAELSHPGRRGEFLRGRALIREALGLYLEGDSRQWEFALGDFGRPELRDRRNLPPLRFNLTHTRGCMVCLINLEEDAGVDVEFTQRSGNNVELADRFFTPEEVRDLRALPEAEQRDQFFRYWTLKESYMKARGMGMSLPLDQFGFKMAGQEPLGISFGSKIEDKPEDWSFSLNRLGPEHQAAAGVRRLDRRPVMFRWRELAAGS